MEDNFAKAHKFTAKWEGGFSDHPADNGGITAYGASIEFVKGIAQTDSGRNFLQAIGVAPIPVTKETIRKVTKAQAEAMFKREFWTPLKLDSLPFRQAAMLYDASVNCGKKQALKFSQRGYSSIARGQKLDVDGIIGPKTRAALANDSDALVRAVINERRKFYHSLADKNPSQKVFLKGWLNRADDLERFLLTDSGGRGI